jgi:hypothetical protein
MTPLIGGTQSKTVVDQTNIGFSGVASKTMQNYN